MKWFEMGYDRGQVAGQIVADEQIAAGQAQKVHEGYRLARWNVPAIGTYIFMHAYEQRNIYDAEEGCWTAVDSPFFRAQIEYTAADKHPISSLIDFNYDHAMLVRSSELCKPGNTLPDPFEIWDHAMAALDEALYVRARQLGIMVTAQMIERESQNPHLWAA